VAIETSAKRNLKIRKILFASTLVFICISLVYATYQQKKEWVVPEEAKIRKNPLPPSEAGLKTAREVYLDECAKCHGESGRGDGPEAMMHEPSPADLTDSKRMSAVTDGEIFYQISEGKRPMPSFKNRMTEDQRWQLVLLVRSFAQSATVPEKKPEASDMKSSVGHQP
jgi:mono/diheme cytochrome c family protein